MAAAAKPDFDTKDTATFVVAYRRSVVHDGVPYNGGDEVVLPKAEGLRLRTLGFFVDEDGTVTISDNGPKTINGVEIKEI